MKLEFSMVNEYRHGVALAADRIRGGSTILNCLAPGQTYSILQKTVLAQSKALLLNDAVNEPIRIDDRRSASLGAKE